MPTAFVSKQCDRHRSHMLQSMVRRFALPAPLSSYRIQDPLHVPQGGSVSRCADLACAPSPLAARRVRRGILTPLGTSHQTPCRHALTRTPPRAICAPQVVIVAGDFYFLPSTASSTGAFVSSGGTAATDQFGLLGRTFACGVMVYLIVRRRRVYDVLLEC